MAVVPRSRTRIAAVRVLAAEPKSSGARSGFGSVEPATKVAAIVAAMAYATGLIVVNYYLLPYGASDFNLFRARFVLTGLIFLVVVLLSAGAPWTAANLVVVGIKGQLLPHDQTSKAARAGSILMRGNMFFCAAILLATPFGLYVAVLKQPAPAALSLYFAAGVLGALLGLTWYFTTTARHGRKSSRPANAMSPNRVKGMLVGLLVPFLIGYLAFAFVLFAHQVYPRVPEQLGGAKPKQVVLLLNKDDIDGVRQLGLNTERDDVSTAAVDLLFHGEDFYLVRANGSNFVLDADLVKAVYPVHTGTGI